MNRITEKKDLLHVYWLLKKEKVTDVNEFCNGKILEFHGRVKFDLKHKGLKNLHMNFNFRNSDFSGSNFSGSNFSGSNFSDSNFRNSNFSDSNFSDSNFRNSNFRNSNFSGSNFSGSNFRYSHFRNSDFSGSNFRYSHFSDSHLSNINWDGSNFNIIIDETTKFLALQCPEEGSFIGWKKCRNSVIVKLKITENSFRSSATTRKCRASEVEVLEIFGAEYGISKHDENTIYRKGDIIRVENFDYDRWNECSTGIHFFLTRKEAESY